MEYFLDILKRNIIGVVGILIGIISISISAIYVSLNLNTLETDSVVISNEQKCSEDVIPAIEEKVKVDVKGAVKKPGVYELNKSANILDAIGMAGGVTSKGTTSNINLSKRLNDEMVIYVFTKDEIKKNELNNSIVCEIPKCECETVTITECPNVNSGSDGNNQNDNNVTQKKVSINKGTLEDLMTLEGIGESKAKAIIEYREKNGGFKTLDEIKNVNGIGDKAYEQLKDKITL